MNGSRVTTTSNGSNNNKENLGRNAFNGVATAGNELSFSSVTSVSHHHKETDLHKANEKIKYLEHNLRTEMLNSEEQRSLLAILKQELERKLHEFGFMNFFKTSNSAVSLSHIDIYMELQVRMEGEGLTCSNYYRRVGDKEEARGEGRDVSIVNPT